MLAAAFTTVSELILPLLLSYLTDWAQIGVLDAPRIVKVAIIYAITKAVSVIARYFMQSMGHIMGA